MLTSDSGKYGVEKSSCHTSLDKHYAKRISRSRVVFVQPTIQEKYFRAEFPSNKAGLAEVMLLYKFCGLAQLCDIFVKIGD